VKIRLPDLPWRTECPEIGVRLSADEQKINMILNCCHSWFEYWYARKSSLNAVPEIPNSISPFTDLLLMFVPRVMCFVVPQAHIT